VTNNFISMGQQFWVLKKMPPPNLAAKEAPKEVSPEVAKALAPKPGVKPVNPKKGPKPKADTTTPEPAAEAPETEAPAPTPGVNGRADEPTSSGSGTARRPQDTRNRKRKGGRR
jgi:YidC/Oxa1 family membrane protein insertase